MLRVLFEKTGDAIWMSHLDLMRLFQRAFKRAGLPLTHTQGFNPRPSVSIALPLSVGVESWCELLDFELDGESIPCDEICIRLQKALIPGVKVLSVYDTGRKIKELALLRCCVTMEFDKGIPENAQSAIRELFTRENVIVPKKGKNGIQDQDLIPLIKELSVAEAGENELVLDCVICCQNPSLNPSQIISAIEIYLPDLKPDFSKCKRIELYDLNEFVFR